MQEKLVKELVEYFEQDDLEKWLKLIRTNEEISFDFLKEISKIITYFKEQRRIYSINVLKQIRYGLEFGLNKKEILFYSRTDLTNENQMEQIRKGFENKLSFQQIKIYARPEFSSSAMEEIRLAFQKGLSIEQVSIFAKPEFNASQMYVIKHAIERGLYYDKLKIFARPEFDSEQMRQICEGLGATRLTTEQVLLYATTKYNSEQMLQIRLGLEEGLKFSQIITFLNLGTSKEQIIEMQQKRRILVKEERKAELVELLKHIN